MTRAESKMACGEWRRLPPARLPSGKARVLVNDTADGTKRVSVVLRDGDLFVHRGPRPGKDSPHYVSHEPTGALVWQCAERAVAERAMGLINGEFRPLFERGLADDTAALEQLLKGLRTALTKETHEHVTCSQCEGDGFTCVGLRRVKSKARCGRCNGTGCLVRVKSGDRARTEFCAEHPIKSGIDVTLKCERGGLCTVVLHTSLARKWIKECTKTESWQMPDERTLVIDDQQTARELVLLMSRAGLSVEGL